MNSNMRKWIVSGFLLGAMAFVGAPNAQAQYPQNDRNRRNNGDYSNRRDSDDYRYGDRSGRQGNFRDYQREIRFLEERIRREKAELRWSSQRNGRNGNDRYGYGRNGNDVRGLRERIKSDERELKQLKKEWKRYQKENRRWNGNDRGPYGY